MIQILHIVVEYKQRINNNIGHLYWLIIISFLLTSVRSLLGFAPEYLRNVCPSVASVSGRAYPGFSAHVHLLVPHINTKLYM